MPKSKDPEQGRLDPLGAVLSIVGISSLVYGLIEAPENGMGARRRRSPRSRSRSWCSPSFVFWELHTDEPMLDMRFFRNPAFSTGSGGMMLVFLAMYGVMFLITQYFQLVLGYSPSRRRGPLAADGADHDHRRAAHAAAERPLRRQPRRCALGHAADRHRLR